MMPAGIIPLVDLLETLCASLWRRNPIKTFRSIRKKITLLFAHTFDFDIRSASYPLTF